MRIFWSSPGYSHCCFTVHDDVDPALAQRITAAFLSVNPSEPAGRAVLDGEHCGAFVPGTTQGWDTLERAAEEEGLI